MFKGITHFQADEWSSWEFVISCLFALAFLCIIYHLISASDIDKYAWCWWNHGSPLTQIALSMVCITKKNPFEILTWIFNPGLYCKEKKFWILTWIFNPGFWLAGRQLAANQNPGFKFMLANRITVTTCWCVHDEGLQWHVLQRKIHVISL